MDALPEETALRVRMTALARTFPSTRNAPGVDPWRADLVEEWAKGPISDGERMTARFLLSVWDPRLAWELDPFDVMEALKVWSLSHHEAFLRWARKPWWP